MPQLFDAPFNAVRRARAPLLRPALRPLAAALALCGVGSAWSQTGAQPYYIGLNETISHDSNIYKLSNAGSQSSTTQSSTSLIGGVDQPLGREQLHADAYISENRYLQHSELNNTSYGLDAVVNWSTVARISGIVGMAYSRGLANYAATTLEPQVFITRRNIVTSQTYYLRASKGMATQWSVDGGLAHRAYDYSAPEYASGKFNENSGDVGLTYHPSDLFSVGVSLGYARGEFPDFVPSVGAAPGDSYVRRDYNLHATYAAGGFTSVYGRIGYTQQSNNISPSQDFSGLTGALNVNYAPGGKLSYGASISRDTGNGFNPIAIGTVAVLGTTNVGSPVASPTLPTSTVANTIGVAQTNVVELVNVNYAATSKVGFSVGYSHNNQTLRDAQGGDGSNSTNTVYANARYQPQRYLGLGCGVSYGKRSSDSALSGAYTDRFVSCSAQVTLR